MANKNEIFKPKEYIELSETLLKNADILTGKLGSLKRDGENLKRTYDSLFNVSKEDLDYMLATNEHFAELYEDLRIRLEEHNNLINSYREKLENLSSSYHISIDDAQKALELAKEYNDAIEEQNKLSKEKDDINRNINNNLFDLSYLRDELNDLESRGLSGTDEYKNVENQIKEIEESIVSLSDEFDNINASIDETNKKASILKSKLDNNSIAKKMFDGIENGNAELSESIELLDEIEESTKNINTAKSKYVNLTKQGNDLTQKQNKDLSTTLAIINNIWGLVKQGGNKWIEIDDKVSKVSRSIGLSTNQIRGYQQNILTNYSDMAARLGMTTDEMMKFQESYTKNTGRAISLTNEQVESLGAMSRLVGDVATNDMVKNMDDFGASTQTATSYLALNMARAKSQGLDAQKASETFAKNVKLASKYTFSEGVNGISKMTLLSQKLKFNMDSIANAAEKFETVEGAIGTAANIQMLGGSYAAQFGNPLEAMNMAMLDMEGFTQKIVDTFSGKAIFNRETGQVEMSAIDKRLMKEAAKQLGINYEEAWNMASQKAKISDVERQINTNNESFTKEEKDFITSKTQYNAEKKQHYVTFYDAEGKEQNVAVKDLTKSQLDILRSQKDVETAMYSDVHGMHSILKAYVEKEAGDTRSLKEIMTGAKESRDVAMADNVDFFMNLGKTIIGGITSSLKNFGEWFIGATIAFNAAKIIGGSMFGNTFTNFGKRYGLKGIGGIKNIGKSIGKGAKGAWNWTKGATKGLGGGIAKGASKVGGFLMRMPGWAKVAGTAIAAIGGGMALMSAADGSQVNKERLGQREVDPNDINTSPINSENVEETKELTELEKQTVLLQTIAEKQGVDTAKILDLSKTNISNTTQEAGFTESSLGFLAASFGDKIYNKYGAKSMPKAVQSVNNTLSNKIQNVSTRLGDKVQNFGAKLGDKGADIQLKNSGVKKLGGKALNKLGNKTLQNVGGKVVGLGSKLATKGLAGPAGWVGFGVDMINMGGQSLGLWEEGSHTDKLMNIGSKTASFAGIGAMIAGPVGAAVGGAVGLVTGTIQQYGKEIKAFGSKVYTGVKEGLFGKDNMTEADKIQQSYEETKIGIVDITDPQLEQKAYLATCKIHDIVVSMWHHMNGKQSNGLKEDKGLLGGLGSSINTVNNTIGGALVSTITSPFKVVGGLISSIFNGGAKSNVSTRNNEYSSISSKYINSLSTRNNSVVSNDSYRVSNINDLSSVDKQYINKASKSLGISEEEFYNQYSYSVNKNGYVDSNTTISGNPIRVVNNNEYDLINPQQRRDYLIDNIDRNRGRVAYYNKLNSINATYQQLYGLEPKPYNTNDYNSNVNYDNNRISSFNSVNGYSDLSYINHNSNLVDNISVKEVKYNNNGLMSKPTVGEPTFIKNTNDFINQSYNNSIGGNNKIDLNVTGSIKLTSDRGNNVDVDMSKLLNDAAFVRKLTEIITDSLNKNSNGGRRENNSVGSLTYGSSLGTRNQSNSLYR